jgi:hypothetical protein
VNATAHATNDEIRHGLRRHGPGHTPTWKDAHLDRPFQQLSTESKLRVLMPDGKTGRRCRVHYEKPGDTSGQVYSVTGQIIQVSTSTEPDAIQIKVLEPRTGRDAWIDGRNIVKVSDG